MAAVSSAMVLVAWLVIGQPADAPGPFVGSWELNLSDSRLHFLDRTQQRTLTFAVTGATVEMTDIMVDASGQRHDLSQRFQVDGREHPHPMGQGFLLVARALDTRTIEVVAKKDGQVFAQVRYEVSADGGTLTARALDTSGTETQTLVFERQSK